MNFPPPASIRFGIYTAADLLARKPKLSGNQNAISLFSHCQQKPGEIGTVSDIYRRSDASTNRFTLDEAGRHYEYLDCELPIESNKPVDVRKIDDKTIELIG
ncbi:MAG: hypothetical protein K2X66_10385 [Cyanobacteria bacterium]|nr:hypothetical protein [Cyanobacteriota bacterium]